MELTRDAAGQKIQLFVWQPGRVAVTEGPLVSPKAVYCVVAGTIVITWPDASESTRAMTEGECFSLEGSSSVAITSGTYDWMA